MLLLKNHWQDPKVLSKHSSITPKWYVYCTTMHWWENEHLQTSLQLSHQNKKPTVKIFLMCSQLPDIIRVRHFWRNWFQLQNSDAREMTSREIQLFSRCKGKQKGRWEHWTLGLPPEHFQGVSLSPTNSYLMDNMKTHFPIPFYFVRGLALLCL